MGTEDRVSLLAQPRARKLLVLLIISLSGVIFVVGRGLASSNVVGCDGYGVFGYGYSTSCDAYPATAQIDISHSYPQDLNVTLGVGDDAYPLWSTSVTRDPSKPGFSAVVDISAASAWLPPNAGPVGADGYAQNHWFIKINDNTAHNSSWTPDWGYVYQFAINDGGSYYYADLSDGYPTINNFQTTVADIDGPDDKPPFLGKSNPSGTVYVQPTDLQLGFFDQMSGVDVRSLTASVDGSPVSCQFAPSLFIWTSGPVLSWPLDTTDFSCQLPAVGLGDHQVDGTVSDYAGNTASFSQSFTYVADTTAPTLSNLTPAADVYNTTSTSVGASFQDLESGIDSATAAVYVDGNRLNPWGCTVDATHISCMSFVLYNSHTVRVTVLDRAGNMGEIDGSFNVLDTLAPTIQSYSPSGTVYNGATTITASYYDNGMGVNAAADAVYVDGSGSPLAGCTAGSTSVSCPVTGLAAGTHTYQGFISDGAGNVATFTGSFDVVIDSTPPVVSSVSPSGNLYDTRYATVVVYYADDVSGVDSAGSYVYIDGTLASCARYPDRMSCNSSRLDYGPHTITGSVRDNAGNTAPINGAFTTVDTIAPAITYVRPASTVYLDSGNVTVGYSDDSGIDTASLSVYLDGNRLSCSASTASAACPYSGLALGSHSITGSVADVYGNVAPFSAGFDFSADTTAPTLSVPAPNGSVPNQTYLTFQASYSDGQSGINSSSAAVYVDGLKLTGCWQSSTMISCPAYVPLGNHTITAQVADLYGNVATSSASLSNQDTLPPQWTGMFPTGIIYTGTTTINASYSDNGTGIDSASAYVYLDGTALSGCSKTSTYISCPVSDLKNTYHSMTAEVSDMAGNQAKYYGSFQVVDITAPTVTGSLSGTVYSSSVDVYAIYTDDISGVNTASVAVYLDGPQMDGCVINDTQAHCPAQLTATGLHNFTVRVTDNAGNTRVGSGSFFFQGTGSGRPALSVSTGTVYWASFADYMSRRLSVDYQMTNQGSNNAYDARITETINTGNVVLLSQLPARFGILAPGGSGHVTLVYSVPDGVISWRNTLFGAALDGNASLYSYP